ncbi:hypothetical protein B4119_2756 [Parageobacillus caldoxylosilyticus]|jgi:hypothetical protein|uniref:Uncharacterized protein n=1 Tax=Saccharococcus caldoxylosilyticus TaxID=81408 RepID=A0A150LC36_9BACL|nr:hypothetical protein B4119_2756 [Parageobacillus caldoxylosilyticus]OQP02915.1 hypothetical protein BSK33_09455 [Geobacillus sp. 44B]
MNRPVASPGSGRIFTNAYTTKARDLRRWDEVEKSFEPSRQGAKHRSVEVFVDESLAEQE